MRLSGPALTLAATAALLALSGLVLAVSGTGEEGLRAWIRATARSSVLLFLLAFVARPLHQLWRTGASAWLLANRRWLGLSFAASHGLHGAALVAFSLAHPDVMRAEVATSTLVLGGLGFAFTAALAATSTDGWVRRLGAPRWRALHRTGVWFLWLVFTATFGGAASARPAPLYVAALAALVAASLLRLVAWARKRTRTRQPAPA